jgi:hypothetical protein
VIHVGVGLEPLKIEQGFDEPPQAAGFPCEDRVGVSARVLRAQSFGSQHLGDLAKR